MSERKWSIGHQPIERGDTEPTYEEIVGTNWYEAASRLQSMLNDWAAKDDSAWDGYGVSSVDDAVALWEAQPPVFDKDASYDLLGMNGTVRRFYLTGERS